MPKPGNIKNDNILESEPISNINKDDYYDSIRRQLEATRDKMIKGMNEYERMATAHDKSIKNLMDDTEYQKSAILARKWVESELSWKNNPRDIFSMYESNSTIFNDIDSFPFLYEKANLHQLSEKERKIFDRMRTAPSIPTDLDNEDYRKYISYKLYVGIMDQIARGYYGEVDENDIFTMNKIIEAFPASYELIQENSQFIAMMIERERLNNKQFNQQRRP